MSDIIWGIHAGSTGEADRLFLNKNVVAIGWKNVGDLSQMAADREAFKQAIARAYPNKKPGAIRNNAGMLYRFMYEMKIGDKVIYPSKQDRLVHIGEIMGDYQYDPKTDADYPNFRAVKWQAKFPRSVFSQGALYEIGSAMSLFQVKNFSDEFLSALHGAPSPTPVEADESIKAVAQDIEENTRDFILKSLAQELKGHRFAEFISHLLYLMGYRTRLSPEGPDGGVDIIAHKDELGFEPPIIKVQVKSSEGSVGDPVVSALYGKVDKNEYGLLVTLGTYTKQALNFARSKPNLRLIDGDELVSLILDHYDQFDSTYKGILPLKRVYIPQLFNEEEEEEA